MSANDRDPRQKAKPKGSTGTYHALAEMPGDPSDRVDLSSQEREGLGTQLQSIARDAGALTGVEAESLEQLRDKTPAEPWSPGS